MLSHKLDLLIRLFWATKINVTVPDLSEHSAKDHDMVSIHYGLNDMYQLRKECYVYEEFQRQVGNILVLDEYSNKLLNVSVTLEKPANFLIRQGLRWFEISIIYEETNNN